MKKDVSYGQIIRKGILSILAILFFLGCLSFGYAVTKNLLDSAEAENVELESNSSVPNISEEVLEESLPDSLADSEQDNLSNTTDISSDSNLESQLEESSAEAELISQTESKTPDIQEETTTQVEVPSEYVGTVCLTFDDGPSLEITSQILDILEEKNVKATFFVLNYSEEKLNIINREINDGHTVALHGYSHEYSEIYSSLDSTVANFVDLQEKLYADTGYYTNFIRFPGGSSNTVSKKYCKGIMTEATQTLTDMGFIYWDWNVDSQDAGGAKSAEEIYNNVTSSLVKGRTNVVLMHDASNKIYTLEALDNIIDYCLEHLGILKHHLLLVHLPFYKELLPPFLL